MLEALRKSVVFNKIQSEDIKKIENYILENKKIELKGLDLFKLRSNTEFWCGKEILEN